jgi:DMSO/TMAO reductase YedYZ heme-binding membrane subunit
MNVLEVSSASGLLAVLLTTASLCLGLMMAVGYRPRRFWRPRPINLLALHNRTASLLSAFIALHVLLLLRLPSPAWHWGDVLWPLHSPVQPPENSLGALSLYLTVVVVVTSCFRSRLGHRHWKRLHYLAYPAGLGIFIHGLLANPTLSRSPIDPLDGEKLLVEFCFGLAALATVWAWRCRRRPIGVNGAEGRG